MKPLAKDEPIRALKTKRKAGLCMPSTEVYHSYYGAGYRITGDSIITAFDKIYLVHPGDVILIDCELHHRTTYTSNTDIEGHRINFSHEALNQVIDTLGFDVIHNLLKQVVIPISKEGQKHIENILITMENEYRSPSAYSKEVLQNLLQLFFISVVRYHIPYTQKEHPEMLFHNALLKAIYYIETHFRDDPSLELVAKEASVSTSYLSKLFTTSFGISYSTYLNKAKINHAKKLLIQTPLPIIDIALQCGYSNHNHFCYAFKKELACTPMQYRKQYRK